MYKDIRVLQSLQEVLQMQLLGLRPYKTMGPSATPYDKEDRNQARRVLELTYSCNNSEQSYLMLLSGKC